MWSIAYTTFGAGALKPGQSDTYYGQQKYPKMIHFLRIIGCSILYNRNNTIFCSTFNPISVSSYIIETGLY